MRKQTLDIADAVFERPLPLRLGVVHPCLACGTPKGRVSAASGLSTTWPCGSTSRMVPTPSQPRLGTRAGATTPPRRPNRHMGVWPLFLAASLTLAAGSVAPMHAGGEPTQGRAALESRSAGPSHASDSVCHHSAGQCSVSAVAQVFFVRRPTGRAARQSPASRRRSQGTWRSTGLPLITRCPSPTAPT